MRPFDLDAELMYALLIKSRESFIKRKKLAIEFLICNFNKTEARSIS